MANLLKISGHQHSGKLRAHEHTSYIALGILMLFVGVTLTVYTVAAASPGPEAGSVGLTGTMPGNPPETAATISKPYDGDMFSTSPVEISGTCPKNTLVQIYKNDIFAGSTTCSSAGIYNLEIDLLVGMNKLIARVYDDLNQAGPDSNVINIAYNALPSQSDPLGVLSLDGSQILLNTDAVFRGAFPNKELTMPIDVIGGTPPYAINIQWGDSNNKVLSVNNSGSFSATHTYQNSGTYQISVQASDSLGRIAFLSVASIVNGQTAATTSSTVLSNKLSSKLAVLWPLYVCSIAVIISFWIGERREKKILARKGLLLHS